MPTMPRKIGTHTNTSVDVINAIRNEASVDYRNHVPIATPDADSVRKIGAIIMDYPALQNEFLNALINRIGKVILQSKLYQNPWSMLKKGYLEFGESIEEIFVDLARPFQYDPAVAEKEIFKREMPNVRSAFHIMNYRKFYKTTVHQKDLKLAFLSWEGVNELITKIIEELYTSANYDEFLVMKYMLFRAILDGKLYATNIADGTTDKFVKNHDFASILRGTSNKLEFMKRNYNIAGVATYTKKEDQYIFMDADTEGQFDVLVLASAFNMDKATYMGHRVLVDDWSEIDTERLDEIFEFDPTYVPFTGAELAVLDKVKAVVIDKNFFQIYDHTDEFTEQYNGEGLYWNYWYHVWKTFSVSPFANALVFVDDDKTIAVTSVVVNPSAVTVSKGQSVQLNATVTTNGFAPKTVIWSIDDAARQAGVTISQSGEVTIPEEADIQTITVTATSKYTDTVTGTSTVTVQ